MEFMLLILHRRPATTPASWPWVDGAPDPDGVSPSEMAEFARELEAQGKMRGGAPLHAETSGARLSVRDGKAIVTDGPFVESKELIAGVVVIDAARREEAIEIARRCPHVRQGVVEVWRLPERDVAKRSQETRFLFLLHQPIDESDPDGSKFREMVAYDEELKREGRYVESSQLSDDPPAARIEGGGSRAPLVTDGPFAESKELVGGYYVVEAPDRARAIAIAERCPHAKWGTVEVREILPPARLAAA